MEPCANCKKDISKLELIIAAGGALFCSLECGEKYFKDGKEDFESMAEEVTPESVGLC